MLVRTQKGGMPTNAIAGREAGLNPRFPFRRFPGQRPRRQPLNLCGLGQEKKAAVIDSPIFSEPAKLIGTGVVLWLAYKFISSQAQKKVKQVKESMKKRKHKKKTRKAQRLAERIEDMGFRVRLEDPELWD